MSLVMRHFILLVNGLGRTCAEWPWQPLNGHSSLWVVWCSSSGGGGGGYESFSNLEES
jgi:hypothetical protein